MILRVSFSNHQERGRFIASGSHKTIEDIHAAIALGLEWVVLEAPEGERVLVNLARADTIEHIKEDDDEA